RPPRSSCSRLHSGIDQTKSRPRLEVARIGLQGASPILDGFGTVAPFVRDAPEPELQFSRPALGEEVVIQFGGFIEATRAIESISESATGLRGSRLLLQRPFEEMKGPLETVHPFMNDRGMQEKDV